MKALNSKQLEDRVRADYEETFGKPAEFELTLDGLGMEDFPERDYFLEAGRLLREAAEALREAEKAMRIARPKAHARQEWRLVIPCLEITNSWRALASRIDKLLAGGN